MKSAVNLDTHTVTDIEFQPASLDIWDAKYRLTAKDGTKIDETIDDTYKRVAQALADVEVESKREHYFREFLWALRTGAIPAGRIISNAGAQEHKPATSTINCTVSGTVGDSMDNILNKVHEAGLTLKAGCGIGYEFSTLRPKGAYVTGAGAYTSGPLSFMDIYDKMCFTVSSAGGRRGAQMGTFDVGHPDVMEFIRAKREDGRLRQFNLSLLVTDEFMQAVMNEDDWQLAFPVTPKEVEDDGLDVNDSSQFVWREWPEAGNYVTNAEGLVACKIYKTMPARRVWDLIMASTYDFAEPGFVLIDKVNEMNNNWFCENIRATNPCGEQPLPPYGSCLLGSVNLTRFVVNPFTDEARFDWEKFRKVVKVFTRMLDNVVEINGLPLPQQRNEIQRKRRHGMGFLGLGSTITMLRMRYGDAAAVEFTEEVARQLALAGWEEGLELAQREGPGADHEREVRGHRRDAAQASGNARGRLPGRRQGARPHSARPLQPLHAAHCGRSAGTGRATGRDRCALYAPQLDRADRHDFAVAGEQRQSTASSRVLHTITSATSFGRARRPKRRSTSSRSSCWPTATCIDTDAMPAGHGDADAAGSLPDYFITADEVTPKQHVDIQAAAQKWIDSSISKTANVPTDYPYEDFKDIYLYAYEQGLKGCTTFRFNPEAFQGVLVKEKDLKNTTYTFTLEDGSTVDLKGDEEIEYDGEVHTAANLFDALKEGYYGKF